MSYKIHSTTQPITGRNEKGRIQKKERRRPVVLINGPAPFLYFLYYIMYKKTTIHKKSAGTRCLLLTLRHLEKARTTIIKQQPAPLTV